MIGNTLLFLATVCVNWLSQCSLNGESVFVNSPDERIGVHSLQFRPFGETAGLSIEFNDRVAFSCSLLVLVGSWLIATLPGS